MKLEIKRFSVSYGERKVINKLDLSLSEGEILGVYGRNGSGKSTLCLAIMNLLPDSALISGNIYIDGKKTEDLTVRERAAAIGIIFQNPDSRLFSPSVEDELAFAPENLMFKRGEIEERIEYALNLLDIKHLRDRHTNSLSGGEKQLVAIASVLTMRPAILIADEITSRIDVAGREKIRNCLIEFARAGGSVLTVSHNREDLSIATRHFCIDDNRESAVCK
jgi:energy-coupling factor transporter ATP-binding protein EcfA2